MELTKAEALKMVCCGPRLGMCIASDCMAWRWSRISNGCVRLEQVAPPTKCLPCNGTGSVPDEGGVSGTCPECDGTGVIGHWERVGYCGLAGLPSPPEVTR
jgi:hypothetical protein